MLTEHDFASQKRRADAVARRLADRHTPLIRNAWYVAARGDEITRRLTARTLLGVSVLLYRTEAGEPVALHNRCCHRSFPLSEGKLEGDTVVCRYHGLRYDAMGSCIAIPSQTQSPGKIGVRRYITMERGPLVWIWMGDPALSASTPLPHPEWLGHPDWDIEIGYVNVKGSYVHLHENLLDLSHLSFLHETTFGTPEYAAAPIETKIEGDDIQVWRHVPCVLPPLYAKPLGWEGMRAIRHSGSQFVSPGLHVNSGVFENLELPKEKQTPPPMVKVAQIITPESQDRVHYYYAFCRNFVRGNPEVGAFMIKGFTAAFNEDVYALEKISDMHAQEDASRFYEIDIAADRAGLQMRRHLKVLADREAAAASGVAPHLGKVAGAE